MGHTYTNSRPGQYLTHAHSHITRTLAVFISRFKCRYATLLPTFFVSIPTGFTAEEPRNSFETTVKADFLNPRFFKIPDNSAAERNFPSPVDKHYNSDF